jgi:hypothetical protein
MEDAQEPIRPSVPRLKPRTKTLQIVVEEDLYDRVKAKAQRPLTISSLLYPIIVREFGEPERGASA